MVPGGKGANQAVAAARLSGSSRKAHGSGRPSWPMDPVIISHIIAASCRHPIPNE